MKALELTAFAVLLTIGLASAQEAEKKVELEIVVAGDGPGDGAEIRWVGDGNDLEGLAIGESRRITDESGREITLTRTGDGMQIDVDGETISLPDVGLHGQRMAFVDTTGGNFDVEVMDTDGEDVDVEFVAGSAHVMQAHHPAGVTIIADEPLDESVRESIRSVLISAGRSGEVTFIDGSGDGHPVKVIRKRVERAQ